MSDVIVGKKVILFPAVYKDMDYFAALVKENDIGVFRNINPESLKSDTWHKIETGVMRVWVGATKQGRGSRNIGFLYLTDINPWSANAHGFVDKIFLKDIAKELVMRYTYVEDAYQTFISYCFNTLGIERLGTIIKRSNTLAYKIDKKVGFKVEGVLRNYIKEADGYSDLVMMSILKSERPNSSPAIVDKAEKPLVGVK
jgi:RimJ/RimL family protein N-acetyltransferase